MDSKKTPPLHPELRFESFTPESLEFFSGWNSSVFQFYSTHSTFHLKLEAPEEKKNGSIYFLAFYGCNEIHCKNKWLVDRLEYNYKDKYERFIFTDKNNGIKILGSSGGFYQTEKRFCSFNGLIGPEVSMQNESNRVNQLNAIRRMYNLAVTDEKSKTPLSTGCLHEKTTTKLAFFTGWKVTSSSYSGDPCYTLYLELQPPKAIKEVGIYHLLFHGCSEIHLPKLLSGWVIDRFESHVEEEPDQFLWEDRSNGLIIRGVKNVRLLTKSELCHYVAFEEFSEDLTKA